MNDTLKKFIESKVAPWLLIGGVVGAVTATFGLIESKAKAEDVRELKTRVEADGNRITAVESANQSRNAEIERRFNDVDKKLDKIDDKLEKLVEKRK